MNNKYEELEKWKALKDSGDISEEEYEKEKQSILNSQKSNTNKNIDSSNNKKIVFIAITIIVLIIAVLGISISLMGSQTYSILTKQNNMIEINPNALNRGITKLEKQWTVSSVIGVIYSGNTAKNYLVIRYDNSEFEQIEGYSGTFGQYYYISCIDSKTGHITNLDVSAKKSYGTDYIFQKAVDSIKGPNERFATFSYSQISNIDTKNMNSVELSSREYVSIAIVLIAFVLEMYFIYKKTDATTIIVSVVIEISIIVTVYCLNYFVF